MKKRLSAAFPNYNTASIGSIFKNGNVKQVVTGFGDEGQIITDKGIKLTPGAFETYIQQGIITEYYPETIAMQTKKAKQYYIGERHNPQFNKPYYRAYGQLGKTAAKQKEKSVYGSMALTGYATEGEYLQKIADLRAAGFSVRF